MLIPMADVCPGGTNAVACDHEVAFFAIEIIACLDNLSGWLILAYRISRTRSQQIDFLQKETKITKGRGSRAVLKGCEVIPSLSSVRKIGEVAGPERIFRSAHR